MKVTNASDDFIVVQIGDSAYKLTVEQIAMLVRQAYWRLDPRHGSYLARIIADALIECPPEGSAGGYRSELGRILRKEIREHNPPVGKQEQEAVEHLQQVGEAPSEETEAATE